MKEAYETLALSHPAEHVLVVMLNRPHAANALNTQMMRELLALFHGFAGDPDACRCIVVTGAGERAFCAGADLKERDGMITYVYGSANAVDRNSFESAAWCLKAFSVGADGVLPWQSIGNDRTLDEPTQTALLANANRFNTTAVASIRVMALRHGAQQCELLKQVLDRHPEWNRWHAYALATQKVPLVSVVNPRFVDEAAAATFREMTAENFLQLKEGLLQLLSQRPESPPADRRQTMR